MKGEWGVVKSVAAEVSEALRTGIKIRDIDLSALKFLSVRLVRGTYCVELKNFSETRGIILKPDEWEALVNAAAYIDAEVQALAKTKPNQKDTTGRDEMAAAPSATFDLSNQCQVTVHASRGRSYIRIRGSTDRDGITLMKGGWGVVKSKAAEVSEALRTGIKIRDIDLSSWSFLRMHLVRENNCVELNNFSESRGIILKPDEWEALGGNELAAAPSAANPLGGSRNHHAGQRCPASHTEQQPACRRQHCHGFHLPRHLGVEDGEMLPGYNGIALAPEQFETLQEAADDVSAALKSENLRFKLELSDWRCLRIHEFKSDVRVDIRAYFKKKGKRLPTRKGVSLVAEQWQSLVEGLPALPSCP
ncbi:probable RNA polymerase II transcriptional coactivator KELP at C-terminar half [Coccomyxa sp. Obi]|nr:probable RNA polymerase II transcriptional coactivator KELP at C-terminar half [Coccomyxa sp. Obi]